MMKRYQSTEDDSARASNVVPLRSDAACERNAGRAKPTQDATDDDLRALFGDELLGRVGLDRRR